MLPNTVVIFYIYTEPFSKTITNHFNTVILPKFTNISKAKIMKEKLILESLGGLLMMKQLAMI